MFFSLPTGLRPQRDLLSVLQTSRQSETKGSICNVKIRFMTQNSQVGLVVKLRRIWPELILRPFVWVIKTHPPPTTLVQPNVFRSLAMRWHSSVVTLLTLSKLSWSWCWTRRLPGTFLTLLSFICPVRAPDILSCPQGVLNLHPGGQFYCWECSGFIS